MDNDPVREYNWRMVNSKGKYVPQQQIGRWTLLEYINEGGNAEVWKAKDQNGSTVALKILKRQDKESYPFKRFISEIKILRGLTDHPGVLRLIEDHVPEEPSARCPVCFSMPVAIPVTKAIEDNQSLVVIVDAIAAIAEHLTDLSSKGINHRDIKPSNLYQLDERWLIGDFGIARHPDKEALTTPGHKLGPLYFMAPEMREPSDTVDAALADVYSLAKTLWVLATGQNFPPEGEQRLDVPQMTVSHFVAEPRTQLLDGLIERATNFDPKRRPAMTDFAAELRAWLAPVPEPKSPSDVSDIADRIKAVMEPVTRRVQKSSGEAVRADSVFRKFRNATQPVLQQFAFSTGLGTIDEREIGPTFVSGGHGEKFGPDSYLSILWRNQASAILTAPLQRKIVMVCGIKAFLFADGYIEFLAFYDFGQYGGQNPWIKRVAMPLGSALQDHAITEIADWLVEKLRPALEQFAEVVEKNLSNVQESHLVHG